jgi:ATP-dependent Clp protease ATP-binding subunit ClpC
VVIFNPLRENEVEQIVEIELSKLDRRLDRLGYEVTIDKKVKKFLSEVGFDEKYGARPIKRAIQEKIEDLISEEVLRGNITEGVPCKLKMKGKEEVVLEKGK